MLAENSLSRGYARTARLDVRVAEAIDGASNADALDALGRVVAARIAGEPDRMARVTAFGETVRRRVKFIVACWEG